jgi:hypothetical protein
MILDPNSSVLNYQTRCNNNLAIDFADTNYFASSSLDHPGLVVWDRRVTNRSTASPMYLESIDQEEVPWGAALKLDRVIMTGKGVHIKQLRYSREQRGSLGVLSSAGQLQILRTGREFIEPESVNDIRGSPELLEVKKSIDLEYASFDPDHTKRPEERIVSFDWLNLGTSDLDPRVVGLRSNGTFEILQLPAATAGQLSQLVPWKPPRQCKLTSFGAGSEWEKLILPVNDPYMNLLHFADSNEQEAVLGPLFATAAKADVPLFGSDSFKNPKTKKKMLNYIKAAIHSGKDPVVDSLATPELVTRNIDPNNKAKVLEAETSTLSLNKSRKNEVEAIPDNPVDGPRPEIQNSVVGVAKSVNSQNETRDFTMIRRATDGYLFDCVKNIALLHDDERLQKAWSWVKSMSDIVTFT